MDIFDKYCIKIPNAVVVEGITQKETDEEVLDFLKQYGSIAKTEMIKESDSIFDQTLVVEYSSGAGVAALWRILQYSYCSSDMI